MSSYYEEPFRSEELYHYGVLGMKWGIHRAAKKGGTYSYKSFGTRRNERKARKISSKIEAKRSSKKGISDNTLNKLQRKQAKYERRASRSRATDKVEEAYARQESVGSNIAKRAITAAFTGQSFVGSKSYQQHLAMQTVKGIEPTIAAGKSAAYSFLAGRPGSTIAKAIYMRQGEREYLDQKHPKR